MRESRNPKNEARNKFCIYGLYDSGTVACAAEPYTDSWGCVWETSTDGITGSVHRHPLADESAIESFVPPNPATHSHLGPKDWDALEKNLRERREKGLLAVGGLEHGHTFLRLIDLRGYDNLLMDMVDDEPYLEKLVGMVEAFNLELVTRYLKAGVEYMMYPEDLGMQIGPMISPDLFRKYIKPSYERIMKPARDAGVIVHMHSDGDIRTLADDLVEGGVQVINLQDLCNGIDWIADKFGGKTCVDLDIDRQKITALRRIHAPPYRLSPSSLGPNQACNSYISPACGISPVD